MLGGASATRVPPSGWFLLVCSLGAFGVAIAKRYTELTNLGAEASRHRPVMRCYRPAAAAVHREHRGRRDDRGVPGAGPPGNAGGWPWHLPSAVPLAGALVRFDWLTGRRTAKPVEDMLMPGQADAGLRAELAGAVRGRPVGACTEDGRTMKMSYTKRVSRPG